MAIATRDPFLPTPVARRLRRLDLVQVRDDFSYRLRQGAEQIRAERAAGHEVALLEQHWLNLHRAYQQLSAYLDGSPG